MLPGFPVFRAFIEGHAQIQQRTVPADRAPSCLSGYCRTNKHLHMFNGGNPSHSPIPEGHSMSQGGLSPCGVSPSCMTLDLQDTLCLLLKYCDPV